jgi:hypothetical protein
MIIGLMLALTAKKILFNTLFRGILLYCLSKNLENLGNDMINVVLLDGMV